MTPARKSPTVPQAPSSLVGARVRPALPAPAPEPR